MAIAKGVAKLVAFKKEGATTWGVAAGAAGAQYLRRVTSDLSLTKDTYQSNEIRSDYQIGDFRHGMRQVAGSIDGELSPGTYAAFMAAALRRDFTAVADLTSLTLTVSAPTNGVYDLTRSAGDWRATAGIKIGSVIRVTAGLAAGTLNRNLMVVDITSATVAKVVVLDTGATLAAQSAIAGCTVAQPGKKTYVPLTGHTNDSFSLEHLFSDLTPVQSELFVGLRVAQIDVSLPPTGMATIKITFMGKDVTTAAVAYFTTPTASNVIGVLAAVNGAMATAGAPVALLTGMNFSIKGNMTTEAVVGSNSPPDIFAGSVVVDGSASVFFQDGTFRDYFLNESEVAISAAMVTGNAAGSDFMSFAFPRVKFGGAPKGDGQKGIVQTMPFQALLASTGGNNLPNEQTTIQICDSQAA